MGASSGSHSGPERHNWLTDNSIDVIPREGKSAGLVAPGAMIPVVGMNVVMYLCDSVLNKLFPFFVTSKDPIESHLGICKAFYA